jgi:hypothetical protein
LALLQHETTSLRNEIKMQTQKSSTNWMIRGTILVLALASMAWAAKTASAQSSGLDQAALEAAMGGPSQPQPGGVLKFAMPRKDLSVTLDGITLKPGLALGSWAAFKAMPGGKAMLMGDLVLTESEVGPVMLALERGGIEITALHNHLLRESPRVMYMHVGGTGDAVKLAQTLKTALEQSKTPAPGPAAKADESGLGIDVDGVEKALGHKGKVSGGVLQISVPRAVPPRYNGSPIPNPMGVATGMNFQPTGGGKAAIAGDFVLLPREVNPVLRALREHGIEVTALHSHMLDDSPHMFFMHFWANDDAVKLAQGLRAALDQTASQK